MRELLATTPEMLWLFGGLVGLLAVASTIGAMLSRRAGTPQSIEVRANLVARINAWWVMVAVLAVTFLLGRAVTLVVFGLMAWFALREFVTLTPTRTADRLPLSVAFFVVVPAQFLLIGLDQYGTFSIFVPVYAFLLLPAIAALRGDVDDFLPRTAKLQWGLMITVYCLSHAPALLLLQVPGFEGRDALLLFYLLLVVQMSDVMQYVCGKLWGKTKIAPLVSPSKTVAGFVGGGLAATAIGAAMWWITPFSPAVSAAMSAVIVMMGFLGGLTLSAVKRSLGAKDWGVMIEGHGGMLDRLDSVCFAAPVFFHLTRYFYTP
ncbi:MAG: phosphatidate cytidylyltransferase [Proteobacteria bacterium]|nr:phosphatidate cytidylyltransferase [Pseudomonadota bacterium]MCC6630720.1 phosphatidate cytidylyltransferase [Gammaproteobacteria bacterium]